VIILPLDYFELNSPTIKSREANFAMSSEATPLITTPRGDYLAPSRGDKRGPCPLVNALANHGYIARNGRDIPAADLNAAMKETGLSLALGTVFARPIYNVHQDPKTAYLHNKVGFFRRLWSFLRNHWVLLSKFGMRRRDQKNSVGKPVLDLDQLALPGLIEHDVSFTRRDYLQREGNTAPQADLIKQLLSCSKDGKVITLEDLADLRKKRIQQQLDENPGLQYGPLQHQIACTEIALVLNLLGDGKRIPCEYARAFFQEERLPVTEGWKKRWWWTLGFRELAGAVSKAKAAVGLQL
jgi:hypothetical protein